MIRRLGTAALILGAAACASPSPVGRGQSTAMDDTNCNVRVAFGSFATGIDNDAAAAVDQLIRGDPSVVAVARSATGVEGEYALCVRTRSKGAAARLFEALRTRLGRSVQAPVTLTGPQGRYSAPIRS
jgi:hypothetical protein